MLVALAVLLPVTARATTGTVTSGPVATPSAPVHYYVFRTRDTGSAATSSQNARCNKYFGARSLLTITRLNARLFGFDSDDASGRIDNQTANLLGPGFICAVPKVGSKDAVDAYAYSDLPGAGVIEATGPCGIAPVLVNNLPLILSCALQVKADASKGIQGGMITSNSLVNVLNKSDSAPTGSVWTASVVGTNSSVGGGTGTTPPGTKPDTPGLDFWTLRTRDEQVSTSSPECERAGVPADELAIRTANMSVVQPDPTSGLVPEAQGPSVAKITVCYLYANSVGYHAAAIATLKSGGKTFDVKAKGDCRTSATVAGPQLRAQACALTVKGGGLNGLITSNGLVGVNQPASAANSAVWTFALFGAPKA